MRLTAEKLGAARGGETVFSGISFALGSGDALVVTGPNGAGKSTLLRVIAGLLPKTEGALRFEGGSDEALAAQCHCLGVQNAMKAALSVFENLDFWQRFCGAPMLTPEAALEAVGLAGIEATPFAYLSTGQKRRVAIARLLVSHRPVWLLDEPTSGLDAKAEGMFARLLESHLAEGGIAIAATHLPLGLNGAGELQMGSVHGS
jgi:heme exporter protein A